MSFGFMPGIISIGCEVEARILSIIVGDAVVNTIYATGAAVDWNHPDTKHALSHNIRNVTIKSRLYEHGGDILRR